ncbi:hypothetical protein ACX40Y_12940 [Sphingomonas sp. RS6]
MTQHSRKYCDLVMKGGITSGIVYPNAAIELSHEYRFKNIGGTSAGAIAAAACAAASVGDRRQAVGMSLSGAPMPTAFEGLKAAADALATEHFIYRLFQPARGLAMRYRALVRLIAARTPLAKLGHLLVFGAPASPLVTLLLLVPLALLLAFGDVHGWAAWLIVPLGIGFIAIATIAWSGWRMLDLVRANLLGLCTGRRVTGIGRASAPALTEWLHDQLQAMAGQPPERPLLFNDLAAAPRYPGEPAGGDALTLRMITTDLSHQEPRTLPFQDAGFWFRRDQFERLFPDSVVDWLTSDETRCVRRDGHEYYPLPHGADMPVIVAMRMSFSYPILLSAVPLHESVTAAASTPERTATLMEATDALASSRSCEAAPGRFRPCWFSDGGLSSNFPIHLFDAPLPQWPTFAINLADDDASRPPDAPPVHLPNADEAAPRPRYRSIAASLGPFEVFSYLWSMVGTMQNWRDLLLARAPGNRERIVDVFLEPDEGGLNLDMPAATLGRISAKGSAAGSLLRDKFRFDAHYWVRWRTLAAAVQAYEVRAAANVDARPQIADFVPAYLAVQHGVTPTGIYPFTDVQRAEAVALYERLIEQGRHWGTQGAGLAAGAPQPGTQVQISPIY